MSRFNVSEFKLKMFIENSCTDEENIIEFQEDIMRPDDYESLATLIIKMFCHNAIVYELGELKYTFGYEHGSNYIEISSNDCDIENFCVLITPRAFSYFDNYICYLTRGKFNQIEAIQ